MKLIDLLVQELPKQGGWPTASEGLALPLAGNDLVTSWRFNSELDLFVTCTYGSEVVTREEYEAAIAASQQPAWNGDGLPPVGCECESLHCFEGSAWQRIVIKWSDENQFLYEWLRDGHPVHHLLGYVNQFRFRPIRAEVECKREDAIQAIASFAITYRDAAEIYDAIAAGKIPNITLK